jgi:hypothetical protein
VPKRPLAALLVILPGAVLPAIAGCGAAAGASEPAPATLAENASDLGDLVSQTSSLTASLALGAPTPTATQAAPSAATPDAVPTFYAPAGCVTAETQGASITRRFLDCSGPWGLSLISGTLTASYSVDATGLLRVQVSANSINLRGATIDYEAEATLATNGATRTMTYVGTLEGTTVRGRSFTHTGQWTATWDIGASCITVNGASENEVLDGRTATVTLDGYERCADACPSAGTITVADVATGETVRVTLDGSAVATLTVGGAASEFTLACGL